jgi:hypothetical protein
MRATDSDNSTRARGPSREGQAMLVKRPDEQDPRVVHCKWCKLAIPRQDGRYNVGDLSYHTECYALMKKGERAPSSR